MVVRIRRMHLTKRAPDVRQAGVIIGQIPVPAAGNANRWAASPRRKPVKNKIIFLIVVLLISACSPVNIVSTTPSGTIIDASQLTTSFNESMKMQITTSEYIFIVEGNHSVKLGAETEIVKYSDNQECLRIVGDENCWSILH